MTGAALRVARATFAVFVFALATLAWCGTADAQTQPSGPAVGGTLRTPPPERTPIEGVEIVVRRDGEEIGSDETDADGVWRVEVPQPNTTYEVELNPDSLPKGVALRDPERATLDDVRVRVGLKPVLFAFGDAPKAGPAAWERLLNLAVDGLRFGLVLAVASVGLSLIFGVTGLTNFAHGELVTFGALVAFFFSASTFDLPLVVATVLAVLAGGLFGYAQERVLFRPLRRRRTGNVSLIVVTIGLGLFLRNFYLILFGGSPRPFDEFTIQRAWEIGPVTLRPKDVVIMIVSALVLAAVGLVLQRTRLGTATRAVADTRDLAEASGVDVNNVILAVWVGGAALAALGGVLTGVSDTIESDMGFTLLLLMFAAVVLGGLGTAYGAMVGGVLIGVASQVSTYWWSTRFRTGVALAVLIIVVLVRPQGILGRRERIG
jgi:neutral amino acid transport system permease protein